MLTIVQKHNRLITSKECLALLEYDPYECLYCSINVDESWNNQNKPEIQQQSKQRVYLDEVKKVRGSIINNNDYFKNEGIFTVEYNDNSLDRFKDNLRKKGDYIGK